MVTLTAKFGNSFKYLYFAFLKLLAKTITS
jgi:hypothetical protein